MSDTVASSQLEIIDRCRLCENTALVPVLNYGSTPLANALLSTPDDFDAEQRFPLSLAFCPECSLLQINETVDPRVLFTDYPYFSSFSESFVAAASVLADQVVERCHLGEHSLVVEAASNDGYLLRQYLRHGVPVIGVEPSQNVADEARRHGVRTRVEFFGLAEAQSIVADAGRADVFHANNVLAHVPGLKDFVAGIQCLLKPSGIASIEVPYLREFMENCEFDTVYHEHLCYFSLTALDQLFSQAQLQIFNVEKIPTHGGSLRIFAGHPRARPVNKSVAMCLQLENDVGVTSPEYYANFSERVMQCKHDLLALLREFKTQGRSIAAYGASAKGSTLLNFMGIGSELIDFIVDRSTVKQDRFSPGTHLPILSPSELLSRKPDYVLLLTWNFAEEILRQQADFLDAGGQFIRPIPSPQVINMPSTRAT
ncbi:MAG: class I SAM-dependent methyltransferase [Verrucomicrobia bacterium]|nr:class I SAM-dependent methyltransferase [Verrucomicrobiota bacterium]